MSLMQKFFYCAMHYNISNISSHVRCSLVLNLSVLLLCSMILKEAISYYSHNNNSVCCVFLDATKAFDRLSYCKLFRLLLERNMPPHVVRILMNMYTGHWSASQCPGPGTEYFPTALKSLMELSKVVY